MKRFLSTTAVLLAFSGAAFADAHASNFGTVQFEQGDFFASDLIGMRIYNSESQIEDGYMINDGGETEWDDIGEINDIIVSKDGEIRAVVLGVGGFLGLGERDVTVSMDAIKVVQEKDDADDRFLVVTTSKEILENAPVFEADMDDDMAEQDAVEKDMAETKVDDTTAMSNDSALVRPVMERDGYAEIEPVEVEQLTAEKIQGSYVYGENDETVGEIGSLLMNDDGKVSQAVINVGGFLGLGEKPVAVSFEKIQILKGVDGDDYRFYIDSTQEKLEALPEYED
ncbi:PRC-barrel domain-containing protein [Sulfitobacter geojensis]|uniref:PRC-barrel domain-containing protein n=1 Tax=Sulfitobacter geojensis TaxID=1342299 RepID=UPI0024926AF2|nr:PRC-barrel domain-containing protein [Sulfitobacter geojensis]